MNKRLCVGLIHELRLGGARNVVDWCINAGLLSDKYPCPECGALMKLTERKGISDGFEWRCRRRGHDLKRSLRKGSWFHMSRMSLSDILLVTLYWAMGMPAEMIALDVNVNSSTVTEWMSLCREVCMISVTSGSCMVGGEGVTVEIDESEFGKRKVNRGKQVEGKWVYGGIEEGSNNCFFRVVGDRSSETLLAVIRECIRPGTTVVSDCWIMYECLQSEGFKDLRENYSMCFKDRDSRGHAKTMESTWTAIKRRLPPRAYEGDEAFSSYLYEFMWRRKNKSNITVAFLEAVKEAYPFYIPTPDPTKQMAIEEEVDIADLLEPLGASETVFDEFCARVDPASFQAPAVKTKDDVSDTSSELKSAMSVDSAPSTQMGIDDTEGSNSIIKIEVDLPDFISDQGKGNDKTPRTSSSKGPKGETLFHCSQCEYKTPWQHQLKRHQLEHIGDKRTLSCDTCEFKTSNPESLRCHKDTHPGMKSCDECDYRTSHIQSLIEHKKIHEERKCNSCDFRTTNPARLRRHKAVHLGLKPFACDQCDYRASCSQYLNDHKKRHRGEQPLKCPFCNYRAVSKGILQQHVSTLHLSLKLYDCEDCDFQSFLVSSLEEHKKKHKHKGPETGIEPEVVFVYGYPRPGGREIHDSGDDPLGSQP